MNSVLLMAMVLVGSVSQAAPDSSVEFVHRCLESTNCEIDLFQEISKIYRPPKEENLVKDYILKLKKSAEEVVWKKPIPFKEDRYFNLILYVPATGRYAKNPKAESMALQSHMDMVLAYKFAKPGEDIRPYFKEGVTTEVVDGWIQSKDRTTTLGADNGIGVAIALRYLLDKSLEHPPLELIFTVQEELGLVGAQLMTIPVKSKRMICLDGMAPEPKAFLVGSQGASRNEVLGSFKGEAEKNDSLQIQIYVGNLAGGHSGGAIHMDRLNVILGFSQLMNKLHEKHPGVKILNIIAGDPAVANKIPNMFSAVVSFPKDSVQQDEIQKFISEELKTQILSKAEENHKDYEIKVTTPTERVSEGLSADLSKIVAAALSKVPQGVLEKSDKYPHGVTTSSNMGYWVLEPKKGKFDFNLSTMTRSFNTPSLQQVVQKIKTALTSLKQKGKLEVVKGPTFGAWHVPETSPLKKKALSIPEVFNKTFYINGGLEPSAFLVKYPKMDIIAIAPYTLGAHTINERLQVSSIGTVSQGLAKLLSSL